MLSDRSEQSRLVRCRAGAQRRTSVHGKAVLILGFTLVTEFWSRSGSCSSDLNHSRQSIIRSEEFGNVHFC